MEPPSVDQNVSTSDFKEKLAPNNAENTMKAVSSNVNKMNEVGKQTINNYKNQRKQQYYIDTYNGDPNGNPPYNRMDILEVFRHYVNYVTPDDTNETAKGSAMDISQVSLGLQPTYQTLSDASNNEADQKTSTKFVGYIIRATDLSTANNVVLHLQDTIENALKPVVSLRQPVYMSAEFIAETKSDLEVFRLPMMDAMFAFDNPKLYASLRPSSPSPSPSPATKEEGFSTLVYRNDDVGWPLLLLGVLGAIFLIWTRFNGKHYLRWCQGDTKRRKPRAYW